MKEHTHKYVRARIGKNKYMIYRCAVPGCTHFIVSELIAGRKSICWRCGKEFFISEDLIRKKPHCNECTRRKDKLGELTDRFIKVLTGEQG
jgi:hypothetical protein